MGLLEELRKRLSDFGASEEDAERQAELHDVMLVAVRKYAAQEIGRGESGSNNDGPDVVKYRRGADTGGAWCASFASWCLEEAARELDVEIKVRSAGAKKLCKNVASVGRKLGPDEEPEPGDLICWHRGKDGSWQGHVGMVEDVESSGIVHTIEGNVGKFPAKVRRFKHDPTHERLYGYFRLYK